MGIPEPPQFQSRDWFPTDPPSPPGAAAESEEVTTTVATNAPVTEASPAAPSVFDYLSGFRLVDDTVKTSAKRLGIVGASLLGFIILGVALSVVAVVAVGRLATPAIQQLPEGFGSQVSLPDGEYSISPARMFILQKKCFFEGTVPATNTAPAIESNPGSLAAQPVVISGASLAECGTPLDVDQGEVPVTASTVYFVVQSGVASISRLELKSPEEEGAL